MQTIFDSFMAALSVWLPAIVAALAILLIGWIIAKILAAITARLLRWAKLDERLAKGMEGTGEQPASVENLITKIVFYVIMFIAILGSLNALGMTQITALFNDMFTTVFVYLPRVLYALVLAIIAWF